MNDDARADQVLLEAAVKGDEHSFGLLYDRHRDRVFRHLYRLASTREEAEDLVAVVFLEAWRRRYSVRTVDGSILPWLLVTANNAARNSARWHRRYRAFLATLPHVVGATETIDPVSDDESVLGRNVAVRTAFDRLSARDQEVLALCVLDELTMKDAAAVIGVPVGTIKSRLARAKARLAAALPQDIASRT